MPWYQTTIARFAGAPVPAGGTFFSDAVLSDPTLTLVSGPPAYSGLPSAPLIDSAGVLLTPDQLQRARMPRMIRTVCSFGDSTASCSVSVQSGKGPVTAPAWDGGLATSLQHVSRGAIEFRPEWQLSFGGYTAASLVPLVGQAIATACDAVLILCGINDARGNEPFATFTSNYATLIQTLLAAGQLPIPVLPRNEALAQSGDTNSVAEIGKYVSSVNRWIVEFCLPLGIPWIDSEVLVDPTSATGSELIVNPNTLGVLSYTNDGIHPNTQGWLAVAQQALSPGAPLYPFVMGDRYFLPASTGDAYDAVYGPRGNLAPNPFLSGGNPPTGYTFTFLQTRTGKTQTTALSSTYPGQTAPSDGRGEWASWTLSGTGTGGTATDYAVLQSGFFPVSEGNTYQAAAEIAYLAANTPARMISARVNMNFWNGSGGVYTASGGMTGFLPPAPFHLWCPRSTVPIGSGVTQAFISVLVDWNDSDNQFAGTIACRRPTMRQILMPNQ